MKNLAKMVKYGQKVGFCGPNIFLKNIGSVLTSFHTFLEHLEGCLIFFEFQYAKMPVFPTVNLLFFRVFKIQAKIGQKIRR